MKRKGYKDVQEQIKANERYLENNPEAKVKANRSRLKSTCYRFVRDFATLRELRDIKVLMKTREETMKKMTVEKWKKVAEKIKGKTFGENWQEKIEKMCESENTIEFEYVQFLHFCGENRFVKCYEEEGSAGYLILELTFNRSKDGEEKITIDDATYRDKNQLVILKKVYAEWRKNTEECLKDGEKGSVDSNENSVLDDFNESVLFEGYTPVTYEEMREFEADYNWENDCTCDIKYNVTGYAFNNLLGLRDGEYKVEIEEYEIIEDEEKTINKEEIGYISESELGLLKRIVEEKSEVLEKEGLKKVNIIDNNSNIIDTYYPSIR